MWTPALGATQYISAFGWKKSILESIDEIFIKRRPGHTLAEANPRVYLWSCRIQSTAAGATKIAFDLCARVAYGVVAFWRAFGRPEVFEEKLRVRREWRPRTLHS